MTKEKQKQVNALCAGMADFSTDLVRKNNTKWVRLFNCQAYVTVVDEFAILKSYDTIVAAISCHGNECFDFLRYVYGYTATSTQHINKFFKTYANHNATVYTYRGI